METRYVRSKKRAVYPTSLHLDVAVKAPLTTPGVAEAAGSWCAPPLEDEGQVLREIRKKTPSGIFKGTMDTPIIMMKEMQTPEVMCDVSELDITAIPAVTHLPHEPIKPEPSQPGRKIFTFKLWSPFQYDYVLDPQGYIYMTWLVTVAMSFVYNAFVIPLRASFPYQTHENTPMWLAVDWFCDLIYLADVLFFKPRIMFLQDGFWVTDTKITKINYFRKLQFKMDVLSLLPLDLLYIEFGTNFVILRLPRFLKIQTLWELYATLDRILSSPYMVRVGRTLTYIMYLIHVNACAYYALSLYEGLGTTTWTYNGEPRAYIRCFYFATKTATSIGKNPRPENELEYAYMTFAWLMGVFVFALLIGQIRDIIATATRSQTEYRKLVDETKQYMRKLGMPPDMQERVNSWFTFTWNQHRTMDDSVVMDSLPPSLKLDVAIQVHIDVLQKVRLFMDCDPALLRELVLQLKPNTLLPGDVVCRKGDVGKEMYIVKMGMVVVLGGDNDSEILATLREGSVFGEISLLQIDGANRRTATVRSAGFTNLFVLNKSDVDAALKLHPAAAVLLRNKAEELLRINRDRERRRQESSSAETTPANSPMSSVVTSPLHKIAASTSAVKK